MRTRKLLLPLAVLFLSTCRDSEAPSNGGNPPPPPAQSVSVLTQHNDNNRTGWNADEKTLTTANVNPQQFGLVFTLSVDDHVYAQPLVVGHVLIGNAYRNIVIITTVNNTVYAFDGDNGTLYWQKNYTLPGMRPPQGLDMTGACGGNY